MTTHRRPFSAVLASVRSAGAHPVCSMLLAFVLLGGASCLTTSCYVDAGPHGLDAGIGYVRPAKPGPNFVWVKTPEGGYWKYTGPPQPGKVWVPGHRRPDGTWSPGYWRDV